MRQTRRVLAVLVLTVLGCSRTAAPRDSITLATTTSTQDSGLLDVLIPLFEKETGIEVKVVAVGSGQALQLGRRGDADVLLTHAPADEEAFEREGYSLLRVPVMANDFVLVGPPADPARIRGRSSIIDTFSELARRQATFVSRADDSGTHQKEKVIWVACKVQPEGDWYVRAGSGMAQALRMADQKRAYILTDRATYLAQRSNLDLVILSEGDPVLLNPYHVIIIHPEKFPRTRVRSARRFVEFLSSPNAQKVIAEFGIDRHGEPLFFPNPEPK